MLWMTNKKAVKEMEAIVEEYAAMILEDLGCGDVDDILDRIYVSDEVELTTPGGALACEHKHYLTTGKRMYKKKSGSITLYPLTFFYDRTNGELKPVEFKWRFQKKLIRRMMLFTLAHELRHYWQLVTGEFYEHEVFDEKGRNATPYHERWAEKDANEFGGICTAIYGGEL